MTDNLPAKLPQPGQCLTKATPHSEPATAKQGNAELLACLTLVAPSGLTAEDRQAWLAVARQTLTGIPADLLTFGCAEARKRCRFPSEIVPTIISTVEYSWRVRKQDEARRAYVPRIADPEPEYVDPQLVRDLLKSLPA